jgi:hypothetical protein
MGDASISLHEIDGAIAVDDLPGDPVDRGVRGAQQGVAVDELLQRSAERVEVLVLGLDAQGDARVVDRAIRRALLDEPEPLLLRGERRLEAVLGQEAQDLLLVAAERRDRLRAQQPLARLHHELAALDRQLHALEEQILQKTGQRAHSSILTQASSSGGAVTASASLGT